MSSIPSYIDTIVKKFTIQIDKLKSDQETFNAEKRLWDEERRRLLTEIQELKEKEEKEHLLLDRCQKELLECRKQLASIVGAIDQVKEENKLVIPHVLFPLLVSVRFNIRFQSCTKVQHTFL